MPELKATRPHRLSCVHCRATHWQSPLYQRRYSCRLFCKVPFGPFWLFFPVAVIASTWFGGGGPGWVAVVYPEIGAIRGVDLW
jgi:hypothetical protein